jgi:hypothetical protein
MILQEARLSIQVKQQENQIASGITAIISFLSLRRTVISKNILTTSTTYIVTQYNKRKQL